MCHKLGNLYDKKFFGGTSMRSAILFLGTSLVGAQYICAAIEPLGFRPIFLLKIDEYLGTPRHAIEACEHYEADVNSSQDIFRAIKEHDLMKDVVAVTSLLDEVLPNACAVATQYKIIGPDPKLAYLTDKARVQKIIPEFSPPSFSFNLTELTNEQLKQFLQRCFDFQEFILKPGVSSGAVGMSILKRTLSADDIRQQIHDSKIEGAETTQNWMLQPRITGRLHSLEGYVKDGRAFFFGFSRRARKALTESITEFPVDKALPIDIQRRCQEAIEALVKRSGYMNGYFHCEFIITPESAYLIDGNMGRIAGAAIVQQIALVFGKTPPEIYRHVFDLGLFRGVHTSDFIYQKVNDEPTLSINYCLEQDSVVLDVIPPADMVCFHMQVADNGKAIQAIGKSDTAWVGLLAGTRANVLAEIERFVINTDRGFVRPFYILTEETPLKESFLNIACNDLYTGPAQTIAQQSDTQRGNEVTTSTASATNISEQQLRP